MRIKLLKLYVRIRLAIDPAYRRRRAEYIDQYRTAWTCHRAGFSPVTCCFADGLRNGYSARQEAVANPYTIAGLTAKTV
jgi:hypothetical protein